MTIQEILKNVNYCLETGFTMYLSTKEDVQTVKNALEKQIHKKPLEQKYGFCDLVGFFYVRLVCPECKQPIAQYSKKKEYKPRYCHNCGQALDWSEQNG